MLSTCSSIAAELNKAALTGVFRSIKTVLPDICETTSFRYSALYPMVIGSPSYWALIVSCAFDDFSGSSVEIEHRS